MKENDRLISKIQNLITTHHILAICHCGSSWQQQFIAQLSEGGTVLDFADPMLRERALLQPEDVLDKSDGGLVIYNVQNVPEVLENLQLYGAKNCLLITRQKYNLPTGIADVELPVTYGDDEAFTMGDAQLEQMANIDVSAKHDIYDRILMGNLCDGSDHEAKLASYVKSFLQYDVKELTAVSDGMKFYKFMCYVASCTGSVVNYASLGKAADVSSPTAKQWLHYLEGAGIVALLPPLDGAGVKRLAKAPKMYFRDTGLACYLLRIVSREDLLNSPLVNALFETWAVMQIREGYLQAGNEPQLSYYRDSNAKEICLLVRDGDILHPLEIKREPVNMRRVQKKFTVFGDLLRGSDVHVGSGGVIGMFKEMQQNESGLWLIPASVL